MTAHSCWLAILAVVAAGCSSVKTEHPVSDHPEALDKKQLEGAWLFEDEIILHLKFGDDNVGRGAALEWKDGEFRVNRSEFVVAHGGEGRYMSFREEGTEHYELLAYDFASNGDLVVRSEPTDEFERAVAEGRLRGQVKEEGAPFSSTDSSTEIWLASPSDTLLTFLSSAAPHQLFGGGAYVLRKLTGPGGVE